MDPYTLLEVDADASPEEIRRAYKRLAMAYHPDKTGGDEAKADHFKRVSDAYALLSDPLERELYDQKKGSTVFMNMGGAFDLDSLVSMLFSSEAATLLGQGSAPLGAKATAKAGPAKGPRLRLTLAQLMTGGSYTVTTRGPCSACAPRTVADVSACDGCGGRGLLIYSLLDMRACSVCAGTGFAPRECGICGGTREADVALTIDMEPGLPLSNTIPLPSGVALTIDYDLAPHVRIDTETATASLHVTIDITWADWLCGFEKSIVLDPAIAPLHVVSPGPGFPYERPFVVPGRGLPLRDASRSLDGKKRGDLVIHFNVAYPSPRTMTKLLPVFRKLFRREPPGAPVAGDVVLG